MAEKAVRKKTPKKTTKKTTQKRAVKKTTATRVAATVDSSSRKAPTKLASERADMIYSRKVIMLSSALFLVFVGISVAVGFSAEGEIEVSREYERRLSNATEEERTAIEQATKAPQPKNNLPMGGLVGARSGGTNPPKPDPAPADTGTSTASSTDAQATSTPETTTPEEADDSEASAPDAVDTTSSESESTPDESVSSEPTAEETTPPTN